MATRKTIWQRHHITYEPEWTVDITKGEHFVITRLQWLKTLSEGAKTAILYELSHKPVRPPKV
jgi:hypothetical protein